MSWSPARTQKGLALRAGETPERLHLGAVEQGGVDDLERERLDPEAPRLVEVGHGEADGADGTAGFGPAGRAHVGEGVALHDLGDEAVVVAEADAAVAVGALRGRDRCSADGGDARNHSVEVVDVEGHARVADVAGAPVEGERTGDGAGVAPDLELDEVLAVDDPPEGGGGVGHFLEGGEEVAPDEKAAGLEAADDIAVELSGAGHVARAYGELGDAGIGAIGRGHGGLQRARLYGSADGGEGPGGLGREHNEKSAQKREDAKHDEARLESPRYVSHQAREDGTTHHPGGHHQL